MSRTSLKEEDLDLLVIALRSHKSLLTRPNDNGDALAKAAYSSRMVHQAAKKIAFEYGMDFDSLHNDLVTSIWQAQCSSVTLKNLSNSNVTAYVYQTAMNLAAAHQRSPHKNEIPIEFLEEAPDPLNRIDRLAEKIAQQRITANANIKAKIEAAKLRMKREVADVEPQKTASIGRPKNQPASVVTQRRTPAQAEIYRLYQDSLMTVDQYATAVGISKWLLRKYFDGIRPVPLDALEKARQYALEIAHLRATMRKMQAQPMELIVDRWRRMRLDVPFTNHEIADIIGVSRTTVFRWARKNTPQRPTAMNLAKYERLMSEFCLAHKK